MITLLYQWHRRLVWLVTLPLLGWCISGLIPPLITTFYKIEPAHPLVPTPAVAFDSTALSLKQLLEQQQIPAFQQVRWIPYQGQAYYQIWQDQQLPLYLHQHTGKVLEQGEKNYAIALAQHFSGDSSSAILEVERVTQFNSSYPSSHSLLPVYKVHLDRADGLTVYVSTQSSSLATLTTAAQRKLHAIFEGLHYWSFLEDWPRVRFWAMLFFITIGFLSAMSRLLVYGLGWQQLQKKFPTTAPSKWHRRLGLLMAFPLLAFTFSGAYHIIIPQQQLTPPILQPTSYSTTELALLPTLQKKFKDRPVENISLVTLEGQHFFQVHWLLQQEPPSYFNTQDLQRISQGEERYALAQAQLYFPLPKGQVSHTEPVEEFGIEYKAFNRRLPVRKVVYNTPEQHEVYIATRTGELVAVIQRKDRVEMASFLKWHEYYFLEPLLGEKGREAILVLVVLLVVMGQVLEMGFWWGRKKDKTHG